MLAPAFSNYGPALFTSKAAPFSALSTVYSNILIGADYVLGLPVPVTLKNLTIGHNYTVQVWANDPRGLRNTRSETISSAGGNTNTLRLSINYTNTNPGGSGQYIIGNFSADATDQTFILNAGTNAAQLNALQLRDVSSWSSITAQINLVFNGSFGTNAAGWDLTAPGERYDGAAWFSGGNPGGCLELDGLGEGSAIQYLYGLVPGSNYLCSWCGRGIAPLWAFIAVSVRDNNSGITYSGDKSSWEYFGFAFTAQSLTSSDMLGIRNYGFGPYYIDNVSIRSIPETPRPVLQAFLGQNWLALLVSGPSGQSVVLETSPNLVSWQPFATNTMPFFYSQIPKYPTNTFFRISKPL